MLSLSIWVSQLCENKNWRRNSEYETFYLLLDLVICSLIFIISSTIADTERMINHTTGSLSKRQNWHLASQERWYETSK